MSEFLALLPFSISFKNSKNMKVYKNRINYFSVINFTHFTTTACKCHKSVSCIRSSWVNKSSARSFTAVLKVFCTAEQN